MDPTTLGYYIAVVAAAGGSLGGTALGYYLSRRQARRIEAREANARAARAATKLSIELGLTFEWAKRLPAAATEVVVASVDLDELTGAPLLGGIEFVDVAMDLPKADRDSAVHAARLGQALRAAVIAARSAVTEYTEDGGPPTSKDSEVPGFAAAYAKVLEVRDRVLAEIPPALKALGALADKQPPPL